MPEYPRSFFLLAFAYFISLLVGANFLLGAVYLAASWDYWIFFAIVFAPLVALALYHYHARFPSLWRHKNKLRAAAAVLMLVNLVFTALFIAPVVFLLV